MKSSEALIGPYANLMNDVAFQWVFGKESNKDLLLLLLNEFITDDGSLIDVEVQVRPHSQEWDGRVLSSYSLREDENHELMTDSLHFVFVDLSYLGSRQHLHQKSQ